MKLESFNDVLESMRKNRARKFHLLLGNGFSIAYDSSIFSYNALHNFIATIDDKDLSTILSVIETKNFEVIMQHLDNFAALIAALGGDPQLRERIEAASSKLKTSLLDAVRALHPEHVFKVPQEQSEACSRFLKLFLDSGGNLYSTNYDLLLYWVLMRNGVENHIDGCGRELENPEEVVKGEEPIWSPQLTWGKNRSGQNVYYMHGALQFFDTGVSIEKEVYEQYGYLLERISARMENGDYPIFVTAGDGRQKLEHILHNQYLTCCYESLCESEGSLVTFGFNFGPNDEHIIEAINRAAKHGRRTGDKLLSVYIGVYSSQDREHIESIESKFSCKVRIFDATTAPVWAAT